MDFYKLTGALFSGVMFSLFVMMYATLVVFVPVVVSMIYGLETGLISFMIAITIIFSVTIYVTDVEL